MSLHANDGSYNVTVVDGTTYTGIYAADGSYNVVIQDGTTYTGLMHPCGAYNIVLVDSGTPELYHPCGAFKASQDPYIPGTFKVTGAGPIISLSATSIAENASVNDVIGTLSVLNGSGTYTFTITADPDSKFQIANDDELQVADTLDFETETSHSVTIEADNGVDDPITRIFTIFVTNVAEGGGEPFMNFSDEINSMYIAIMADE